MDEIVTLQPETLVSVITVNIKIVFSEVYLQKDSHQKRKPINSAKLRVSIYDPLDKIKKLLDKEPRIQSAIMIYQGRVIENTVKETFQEHYIKDNDMIVLKCPTADAMGGEPQQWFRLNRHIYDETWPMHLNHWEAVVFVARRDVFFMGFGIYAQKDGLDMPLDIQWHIDGEKHEMFHTTLIDADADPENKWHSIDIRAMFDQPPIRVA